MLKRFLRYIDLRGQEEKFDEIDEYSEGRRAEDFFFAVIKPNGFGRV